MTGYEDMKRLFEGADLGVPPVPEALRPDIHEVRPWTYATFDVAADDLYDIDAGMQAVQDRRDTGSFAVGHVGHGVNSYAIGYQVVTGPLIVVLQLAWGGAYMDSESTTDAVGRSFDAVGSLLSLQAPADVADGQLMVVLADFRQVHAFGWLSPGELVDVRAWVEEHATVDPIGAARAWAMEEGWLSSRPPGDETYNRFVWRPGDATIVRKEDCDDGDPQGERTANDRARARFVGEFGTHVANVDLSKEMIPSHVESGWDQRWSEFGLTFDGYAVWGSTARCNTMAERARARLERDGFGSLFLTDLRTLLFSIQRAAHWNIEPDLQLVAGLLRAMKEKVVRRDVEPEPTPVVGYRPEASTQDRVAASLLGLAVGDCLGAGVEGWSPDRIQRSYGVLDRFVYPQTAWTDDTQQALVLAESTIRHHVPDPEWVGQRFVEMSHPRGGRFGIHRGTGRGFRRAVSAFEDTRDWRRSGNVDRAGNGAAMRVAPSASAMWDLSDLEFDDAITRVSLLTHREPRALLGALAVGRLAADLVSEPAYPLSSTRSAWMRRELVRWLGERAEWLVRAFPTDVPQAERGAELIDVLTLAFDSWGGGWEERLGVISEAASVRRGQHTWATEGYVLASVPTAICLVLGSTAGFRDTLVQAVNLGGDADTVGAMVGGMAGAASGLGQIPTEWRTFAGSEELLRWGDGLSGRSGSRTCRTLGRWKRLCARSNAETELDRQELVHTSACASRQAARRGLSSARCHGLAA